MGRQRTLKGSSPARCRCRMAPGSEGGREGLTRPTRGRVRTGLRRRLPLELPAPHLFADLAAFPPLLVPLLSCVSSLS